MIAPDTRDARKAAPERYRCEHVSGDGQRVDGERVDARRGGDVSAGDARHGRRDNGLVAAEYAAAGDVDPRVGEHLLDVLALDGIAAYLRPSTDLHPVTRSTVLPSRPTDRLFVDRAHVATARDYLSRLAGEAEQAEQAERADKTGPAENVLDAEVVTDEPAGAGPRLTGEDVDAAWAQIVAGYDATAEPVGRTSWPEPPPRTEPEPPPRFRMARPTADEPSLLDGLDSFGADLPDDDEDERYTPPVAPPVPRPSMPTTFAVIGIVAGLAMFLKPDLVSFLDESLAMFLGFTAIVSGFGTLVWRLRPGDEDDIDPDDGAKV
jgi:hypothetical protein